ncbi:HigA family addiction module antitoxin [Oleidesulfovibrio alaskensis]|uniref:HigA family addiction module antitoxin n=1 Tax=Oleidesulfovibrio alaskensis TaxID=58180 RepID=UPI00040C9517|nr:HigA family addiction module antitoxin [Oleidesulfovibrio alaskensis]
MRTRTRKPSHPGGILYRMHMQPLGLTITALAQQLGISRKALSAIVNERAAITPDIALRLSRALDTTPELWLDMQQTYTLWETANTRTEWRSVQPIKTAIA